MKNQSEAGEGGDGPGQILPDQLQQGKSIIPVKGRTGACAQLPDDSAHAL